MLVPAWFVILITNSWHPVYDRQTYVLQLAETYTVLHDSVEHAPIFIITCKTKEIILQDTACGHNSSANYNYDKTKMKYVNVYYRTEMSLHIFGFFVQHSNCPIFLTFLIIRSLSQSRYGLSGSCWSLAAVISDNSLWRQTFANAKTSFWFQIRFSTEGQVWGKPLAWRLTVSFAPMDQDTFIRILSKHVFATHEMIGNYVQLNDYG